MRVFISADMEGISGVTTVEDVIKGNPEYKKAQDRMVSDVNTVIEGALEANVETILVNDSHSTMRNIPPESLHPRAELIRGNSKPKSQIQGLDERYDVAMFVGFHAKAGTEDAILNHSYYTNEIISLRVNDEEVGEIGCNARYAQSVGVPVGLVTGDDKATDEAKREIRDVNTVTVKESIDRFSGKLFPQEEVQTDLKRESKKTVKEAEKGKFTQSAPAEPTVIEIDWSTSNQARFASRFEGIQRTGGRTTQVEADTYSEAYRRFVSMMRAGAAGTNEQFG
ncbi:M55 family metallopeptidase [Natrarchaeobius chitinivorans]|uniref:Peptidase M55 n=1 Tax=Natrarchaeobius chitinivorans TaxID=1679083 RepID=A0A3N6PE43_NATCH|nr:M55 family metallopeptidase [Natrarchaeobius chitinivorans]RQG95465.1 peptidase M55 [Natrarchaeobius chitinivorans]